MPDIGLFFLVHVFSAVLPPVNPEDRDYYDVLGLQRSATNEEIRKAYKKKSLQLHPDKVAQRGTQNKEEAAAEYEKVQEAYQVLVNDEKRQTYHALKCSPTRYQFIQRGSLSNIAALNENLVSASFVDKSRLVLLVAVFLAILWIQPILIAAKINQTLEQRGPLQDSKWTAILTPYWIIHGTFIMFWCLLTCLVPPTARNSIILTVIEQILWFVTVVLLANAWDNAPSSEPFRRILTPMYLAMIMRWLQACVFLKKIRSDVARMVSVEHLESEILEGRSFEEDIQEEERQRILSEYIIITVPELFEPIIDENDTEEEQKKDAEAQKVEASPEYDAAIEIYNKTFNGLVCSVLFGVPFIILLVRKLDGHLDVSWWVVFTPLWIYLGYQLLSNMARCVLAPIFGDEVLIQMPDVVDESDDDDGDDENKAENDDDKKKNDKGKTNDENQDEKVKQRATEKDDGAGEQPIETGATETAQDDGDDDDKPKKKKKSKKKKKKKKDELPENPRADSVGFASVNGEVRHGDIETGKTEKDEEHTKDESNANTGGNSKKKSKQDKKKDGESKDKNADDDKNAHDDDDDDESIKIDEDTFRAFQSAYAEAEENTMQKQASACFSCFVVGTELMLLCLIVAKLEAAYEGNRPNDVGFDTFWILFPFLFVFGLICCFCACLIYGAAPEEMDGDYGDNNDADGDGGKENAQDADEEAPIVMAPPPQAFAATAQEAKESEDKGDGDDEKKDDTKKPPPKDDAAADVDMEDLD
mmetsp:Transcript_12574/g.36618  ORF Transcript_12574/g.36618 Transcript_12574/m.36618 type:complete len:758 (+) Transcript_12574:110-2383(+)|eukprot:CAMPEP_0119564834 /NCGR_PEP_ID=MMETSP1352-20130426/28145_1 /TAXON_ID=265584 /ORGANISM="Stauroneis constricta, Strain CCMP1120" /LENGTH=757 /DNA_ID=CAMNT_0007613633 /DNA_START=62 /DNA_END=2335 /DNA_ORIENTATION=+